MKIKNLLPADKGINKYLPKPLIEDQAWSDGYNVHFGPGYVSKVTGYQKYLNFPAAWAAATAYSVGDYTVPATATGRVYKCTTAGVSGAAAPTWPTTHGGTVTDGAAVWTEVGFNKLSGVIMHIDNYYKFNGDSYLMAITTTNCYYYDSANNVFVDITGGTALGGNTSYPVVSENAQNYFVFTNGVDNVKYWDGEMATIENLPGLWQPSVWQASHAYSVGDYCRPVTENNFIYRCSTAGTSGTSEPTWLTTSSTPTADGTATWDLAGTLYSEGGVSDVRCRYLLYSSNMLMLGCTTEDGDERPQRVRWSCLGAVTGWSIIDDNTTYQKAGYGDFTDDVSWVQCLRPMGDYVVVYKERSIQRMYYVGGTMIWKTQPAIIGTGVLAPKAMVDLGDEHIFVGPDNIYSFNLMEPKIAGDAIAKDFFELLDPGKSGLITGFFIEEIPELWFTFTSIDSSDGYPDKALIYNTDTKAWSIRDMPMTAFGYYTATSDVIWNNMDDTWDAYADIWDSSVNLSNSPINLSGTSTGDIYVLTGNSFDSKAIDSYLVSKLFDLGEPYKIKRLLRIQFMISREGAYNLPVYVGTAANVDEDITWYGPYNMSLAVTYPPWVDLDISGRYLCIKLGTTGADEPFKLSGYSLYYNVRGIT